MAAAGTLAPRPLKKPGDATQTIRVAPEAPPAKPVKEAGAGPTS
jgi:hypothetical protein